MEYCAFCNVVSSRGAYTYDVALKGIPSELIVAETQKFFVTVDIAPVIENHCLIVPKRHWPAFAYLPLEEWGEFRVLLNQVERTFSCMCGFNPSIFEHGVAQHNHLPACCVSHAHIHIVPTNQDVTARIEQDGFSLIAVGNYEETIPQITGKPYLYYRTSSKVGCFYDASSMPSQYLRRVLAEALESEIWNWQDHLLVLDPSDITARLVRSHATITENLPPALKKREAVNEFIDQDTSRVPWQLCTTVCRSKDSSERGE